jgi:hypothetical protein
LKGGQNEKMDCFFLLVFLGFSAIYENADTSPGPAPNSGDGIPDGSGCCYDTIITYCVMKSIPLYHLDSNSAINAWVAYIFIYQKLV